MAEIADVQLDALAACQSTHLGSEMGALAFQLDAPSGGFTCRPRLGAMALAVDQRQEELRAGALVLVRCSGVAPFAIEPEEGNLLAIVT